MTEVLPALTKKVISANEEVTIIDFNRNTFLMNWVYKSGKDLKN